MPYKIAIIEFHQETNSFSGVPTTMRDFESLACHYNEDIWLLTKKYKFQIEGFRQSVMKKGRGEFEIIPVFTAWSQSGGPIERSTYNHFKEKAMQALDDNPDLDGIYCSLHGAMGVEGIRDPESDFLGALRNRLGPEFPIGVSFDLHANVTRENIRLSTFIVGYQTNPHRDFYRVGFKCGELLMDTVRGVIKPKITFRKQRIIKGGGWGIDFLPPMRGIIRRMKKMEKMPGVLSVSNFWVHLWIDDPELGWSTLAVTDQNEELGAELADELADRNWKVRNRKHPTPKSAKVAIQLAKNSWVRRRMGTVIFCDVSDIVGAGAPGENTLLLKALMEQAPELVSYVPVRDEEEARKAATGKRGDKITVNIGRKLDQIYNEPLEFTGTLISKLDTQWGKTVILRHKGVHLLLTELPFGSYFVRDYKAVGLNLWKADITVVKNLFPFRFRFVKYNRRTINVITKGITNINVHELAYKTIPRPIHPLDEITDWRVNPESGN